MSDNEPGKPEITPDVRQEYLDKLEPYLKAGLSVKKACLEAKVPPSTVYDLIQKDEAFSDSIKLFQQFLSVLLANSMVRELHRIINKQKLAGQKDKQGNKYPDIDKEDKAFLQWFALNSRTTKDEFGERRDIGLYDPEAEIRRIQELIDSATSKKQKEEDDNK